MHCDFSGGQITSDAGLLPLRAFNERHHLIRDWDALLNDPRNDQCLCHDSLELLRRLEAAFPGVPIKLCGDAGFALPPLYQFCEFFGLQYALGTAANAVFQRRAEPLQKRLPRRYRRSKVPQRSFSSFRHRAGSWSRQRRICYKAEHTVTGTNLRFLTNCAGRASEVFAFYNDRGECENRIEGAPAKPARSRWCKSTALKE